MKIQHQIKIALFITLIISCKMQKEDFLVRNFVQEDDYKSLCYYKNNTKSSIPNQKYLTCFTDTLWRYAIVLDTSYNLVGIDREGNYLYEVFPFDNGPDYSSEGLFRIIDDNKIGFVNSENGEIEIKPKFTFASPFSQGLSAFCIDCERVRDTISGLSYRKGGKWGYINKKGEVTIQPKYDYALSFSDENIAEVSQKNYIYMINLKGEIVEIKK